MVAVAEKAAVVGGVYRSWGGNRRAGSLLFSAPVDDAIVAEPAEGAENQAGRAEAGEHGLDEVEANEGRDEQPPRADEVGEGDAEEGDGAGEEADERFNLHIIIDTVCVKMDIDGPMSSSGSTFPTAKREIPSREAIELISHRFAALSEPTRLRLVHALFEREKDVNTLVAEMGGTQANISRHLQTLTRGNILTRRKAGLRVFYSIADPSILKLCELVCGSLETQLRKQAGAFAGAGASN